MSATATPPLSGLAAPVRGAIAARPAASLAEVRWLLTAGPVFAVLLLWAIDDGGYDTVVWLPCLLALMALALCVRLIMGPALRLARNARWALFALGLYACWSYASITWAGDRAAAFQGANRTLLYLLLFAVFASLEWTRRRLELGLAAYVLGLGLLGLSTLVRLAAGPAPELLQGGQLVGGLGYHNGAAALGTVAAAGAVVLGSIGGASPLRRAALAGTATVSLDLSLLADSRGWLYTLPVIAVTVLAMSASRRRIAGWALIPVCAALIPLPWVAHGYALTARLPASAANRPLASADVGSARAALCAALLSGLATWLLAQLERRWQLSARGRRVAGQASRATLVAFVIAASAAVAMLAVSGSIERGLGQFIHDASLQAGAPRFAQLGGQRYDLWRVGVNSFAAHPAGGLGQDNYAQEYLVARRTLAEPAWVHSLELRLLVHTGAVGLAMFAGFVGLGLRAAWLAARATDRATRTLIAAALVPLTVWAVHGSVDWFWELPALSGPSFALLGAAAALEAGRREVIRPRAGRLAAGAGIVLAASTAAAVLVPTYLGEQTLQTEQALSASAPAAALGQLAQVARLEPLSADPAALASAIELRMGNSAAALDQVRSGLRRDSHSWLLWLEQGLAAGAAGVPGLERAALARARALDPREPVIAQAQQRAAAGHPLTLAEAARTFEIRIKATQGT